MHSLPSQVPSGALRCPQFPTLVSGGLPLPPHHTQAPPARTPGPHLPPDHPDIPPSGRWQTGPWTAGRWTGGQVGRQQQQVKTDRLLAWAQTQVCCLLSPARCVQAPDRCPRTAAYPPCPLPTSAVASSSGVACRPARCPLPTGPLPAVYCTLPCLHTYSPLPTLALASSSGIAWPTAHRIACCLLAPCPLPIAPLPTYIQPPAHLGLGQLLGRCLPHHAVLNDG